MLLAAKSVAYIDPKAGGSSGIYFDKLLDRLGIGDQIRPKAKLKQGGYVAEMVASGEAEVAIHQISEIVPVKGAVLVGPLPAEVQNFTTYSAGLGAAAKDAAAAKALIQFIAGPASGADPEDEGHGKALRPRALSPQFTMPSGTGRQLIPAVAHALILRASPAATRRCSLTSE